MRAQHTKVRLTGSGGQCLPVDSLCHSISALVFCRGWTCREVLPKACWSGQDFLHLIFGVSACVNAQKLESVIPMKLLHGTPAPLFSDFFGCFLVTHNSSGVFRWSWEALLGWSVLCLEPQASNELRLWSKWRGDVLQRVPASSASWSGGKVDNAKPLWKWDCWMSSS